MKNSIDTIGNQNPRPSGL